MLIGPPQLLPEDGAVASPRSIDRPVSGDDTPSMSRSHRANNSLTCRHDNSLDYNDYDPCACEEHDPESEFGESTGSGFTILTDDTQPTPVNSNGNLACYTHTAHVQKSPYLRQMAHLKTASRNGVTGGGPYAPYQGICASGDSAVTQSIVS
jgi:hypothetical protein